MMRMFIWMIKKMVVRVEIYLKAKSPAFLYKVWKYPMENVEWFVYLKHKHINESLLYSIEMIFL